VIRRWQPINFYAKLLMKLVSHAAIVTNHPKKYLVAYLVTYGIGRDHPSGYGQEPLISIVVLHVK